MSLAHHRRPMADIWVIFISILHVSLHSPSAFPFTAMLSCAPECPWDANRIAYFTYLTCADVIIVGVCLTRWGEMCLSEALRRVRRSEGLLPSPAASRGTPARVMPGRLFHHGNYMPLARLPPRTSEWPYHGQRYQTAWTRRLILSVVGCGIDF